MCSLKMTVQLEYINYWLQLFKNISYYAGIMLNAYNSQNYAGIISWCCVINDYIIILFATCSYTVGYKWLLYATNSGDF